MLILNGLSLVGVETCLSYFKWAEGPAGQHFSLCDPALLWSKKGESEDPKRKRLNLSCVRFVWRFPCKKKNTTSNLKFYLKTQSPAISMGSFPKQQNKNNRTKPPASDTTKMLLQGSRHTISSGVVWGATRHTVGSKFRRFLRVESFVGSKVCCKLQRFGRKMDRGERFVAKRLLPI